MWFIVKSKNSYIPKSEIRRNRIMIKISNDILEVEIALKGAELQNIYNKQTKLEYLWDGNPGFWSKRSPVLFPIVGSLKNNRYSYKEKLYELPRHGFARDMLFAITYHSSDTVCLSLISNEETLLKYPFHFIFSIRYTILQNKLKVEYLVENKGNEPMYFSVGAHPAFKVPLVDNTGFEDYCLVFNETADLERWPLTDKGLIKDMPVDFLKNTNKIRLDPSLFYEDALVFKGLRSTSVAIVSNKTAHGLMMHFEGFPYLGIWNARDADFVCIEPWCGIADSENATGAIEEKEGINQLESNDSFIRSWEVEVY